MGNPPDLPHPLEHVLRIAADAVLYFDPIGVGVLEAFCAHQLFELGADGLLELIESLFPQWRLFHHATTVAASVVPVVASWRMAATMRPMLARGLAIDLDGTLLGPDEQISPRNRAALVAARAAGLHIVIATARWYQIAQRVASELSDRHRLIDGPAIACLGAQVRRLSDRVDLLDIRLPAEFAVELYDIVDGERCIVWAALDDEIVMRMDGDAQVALPGLRQLASLEPIRGLAPRMLLVQGSATCARVERQLAPAWSERVRFVESISSHGKRILTLTATGADKGTALRAACADLGIEPSEMIAFGDAENDLPMFSVAGASVAMGQASDAVCTAASFVSAKNVDDGVAVAIERLLADGHLPSSAQR